MQKTDARKLSSEVQQHNREQAIRLHLQGMKRQDIAHIVGIHTSTLGAWIALYNKGGAEALKLGQRGRRKGDGRTLSAPQEKRLKEMMVGQCPDQMELPFALWSSTAIGALIHSLWGIKMGQRTISDYMRRWGYTPQKAAKRAYERSDKATQEWLLKEARRRTKVVGAFPDGNSALMLVAARLRHVSSTHWGTRKYMNMKRLNEMDQEALYSVA